MYKMRVQMKKGKMVIDSWQESLLRAGAAAPRFKLRPGQVRNRSVFHVSC
jgi:hypothetical protein